MEENRQAKGAKKRKNAKKSNAASGKADGRHSRFKEGQSLDKLEPLARLRWEFMRDDPAYTPRYDEWNKLRSRLFLAGDTSCADEYKQVLKAFQEDFGIAFPIDPWIESDALNHEQVMWVLAGVNKAPYIYCTAFDNLLRSPSIIHSTCTEQEPGLGKTAHVAYLASDPDKMKEVIVSHMDDVQTITIQIDMKDVASLTALKNSVNTSIDMLYGVLNKGTPDYMRSEDRLKRILTLGRLKQQGMTEQQIAEMIYKDTPKADDDIDKGNQWANAQEQEKYINRASRAIDTYRELIQGGHKKIIIP
jgi:hypothetical protein